MSDTPFPLSDDDVALRLLATFDAEGKIPRALAALGPLEGRDVVLLDADRGFRARQLAGVGARLTLLERPDRVEALRSAAAAAAIPGVVEVRAGTAEATGLPDVRAAVAEASGLPEVRVGTADATGLPDASVDVLACLWSSFRGPSPVAQVAEADRVLRPGGRLLVVHDYGRDDHVRMEPAIGDDAIAWSKRDGWFLTHGFRIRVIHAFWTFADADEASTLLGAAFGEPGLAIASVLTRPRATHNVAVYHRSRGGVPWAAPDRDGEGAGGHGGEAAGHGGEADRHGEEAGRDRGEAAGHGGAAARPGPAPR